MSENTTELSYWLNWRFLLCALIILFSLVLAFFLIRRYEGGRRRSNNGRESTCDGEGVVYEDEAWKTCVQWINPAWLLGFRVFSFVLLLSLIVGNTVADGGAIFYYYTQLTISLVTIYFGFASGFSIYGYWQNKFDSRNRDMEKGMYTAPLLQDYEGPSMMEKSLYKSTQTAGFWGYLLQIIYQIVGSAVVLTDIVFWLIIFPFLTSIDYKMDFYMIAMHSVNAILLGDTILNCMRFPLFRFGYFILWTDIYVIFQWIVHACIYFWWPYSFLDLSSSCAPLWYLGMALLHIPCYGLLWLISRLKHWWLSKSFPDSYQGNR